MKYLIRFIVATVIWPIYVIFLLIVYIICNILYTLWHFKIDKNDWILKKKDFYFEIDNNTDITFDLENQTYGYSRYKVYYKTPLDMICGKKIKEFI